MKKLKKKNKILAVILNIVLPGLGYIYLGRRFVFGVLLFGGVVTTSIDMIAYSWAPPLTATGIISTILVLVAFGYDAYRESVLHDQARRAQVAPSE